MTYIYRQLMFAYCQRHPTSTLKYVHLCQRFWFTGACKPGERKKSSSKPLALAQFMSAFFLLGCGVCLSIVFLIMEHLYFKYLRSWASKVFGGSKWCALISLSMADSLMKARGTLCPEVEHYSHILG